MKRLVPLIALGLTACAKPNYVPFNGFAQGTSWSIVVADPPAGVASKIDATFDEIDLTFSMFNPASLTSRINRGETDVTTPFFEQCFALAQEVNVATEGYFDSTVGPLVDAWGFGPGGANASPDVDSILAFTGMDLVRIEAGHIIKSDPRVKLDFSSIAKGFTVDCLARMLDGEGVTDYMVEVGGEVRARGVNSRGGAWRIAIDKPSFELVNERETVINLGSSTPAATPASTPPPAAIATSGNYRNWFVDEAGRTRVHIIDPKTGIPALGEILSVSVVAAECAVADAWATGLVACGSVANANHLMANAPDGIEFYIIHSTQDGAMTAFHSTGFPIEAASSGEAAAK
jgi:thiamine biosynthesis lipoprotein